MRHIYLYIPNFLIYYDINNTKQRYEQSQLIFGTCHMNILLTFFLYLSNIVLPIYNIFKHDIRKYIQFKINVIEAYITLATST